MDVIATIWKQPYRSEQNQAMIDEGADVLRIKCSHHSAEDISQALLQARHQINTTTKHVRLLADLPEAKIRLGEFPQEKFQVNAGTEFRFLFGPASSTPEAYIPVMQEKLGSLLQVGDQFYVGDGILAFEVTHIHDPNEFIAKSLNDGTLIQRSSLTAPRIMDQLDHVTPFLDEMIPKLRQSKPDLIAFSFVSSGDMLKRLKEKLLPFTSRDWQPQIIAKIESQAGVTNINDILDVADGIMVARGDLALNADYGKLGLLQKQLVAKAFQRNKYCIVATGALQSLLYTRIPHRSDILDITNMCLDGASAVMLCTETAHNDYPAHAVKTAKHIISNVKRL